MSVLDDLIGVRALINTPEKWSKGALFRDAAHEPCHYAGRSSEVSPDVVSMCFNGAKVKYGIFDGESDQAILRSDQFNKTMIAANPHIPEAAPNLLGAGLGPQLVAFNNATTTTHAMMMEAFDRAIAYASKL